MRKLYYFLFCSLLFTACQNPEKPVIRTTQAPEKEQFEQFSTKKSQEFDTYFERLNKIQKFNGTILIEQNDSIYKRALGYSRLKEKTPLRLNHAFQLASVSKPLTATAIMQLVADGRLELDEKVQDILPGFPFDFINVKMLLKHRSGLANYMYITDTAWTEHQTPMCLSDAVNHFNKSKPLPYFPVNRRFNYCNTNYMLLAAIVEAKTEQAFEEYMFQELFKPFGMDHSFIYTDSNYVNLPEIAVGHDYRKRPIPDFYLNGIPGDKGAYSTVEDLHSFVRNLNDGKIIPDSLVNLMQTPQHPLKVNGKTYGMGWRIRKRADGSTIVFHHGWWRGYKTYLITDPSRNLTIILLTNWIKAGSMNQEELLNLI